MGARMDEPSLIPLTIDDLDAHLAGEDGTTFSRCVLDLTRDGAPPGTAGERRVAGGPAAAGGAGQAEP